MKKCRALSIGIGLLNASFTPHINACPVEIRNDTNSEVNIVLANAKTSYLMVKNSSISFGSKEKKAKFSVLIRQSSGEFKFERYVEQTACDPEKKTGYLTISGILEDKVPGNFRTSEERPSKQMKAKKDPAPQLPEAGDIEPAGIRAIKRVGQP